MVVILNYVHPHLYAFFSSAMLPSAVSSGIGYPCCCHF